MIQLAEKIWIGNSLDERHVDLSYSDVSSILNVAHDLHPSRGWNDGIEYMHVGLIDGPGNTQAVYHAAVLALAELQERGKTLVCCHSGGRALAVVVMYLWAVTDNMIIGWDTIVRMLQERVDADLPPIHAAHKEAAGKINWGLLNSVIRG